MTRSAARAAALFACLPVSGCATATCWTFRDPVPAPRQESVQVTFLGVGGVNVRWRGSSVMTAPLYSNPTLAELVYSEIHSDRLRVQALLHQDVSDARAILVGHAHYDHALDVAFVVQEKALQAAVIGNDALVKLLAPVAKQLPAGVVSLEGTDACAAAPDATADGRFRIRAIRSEHSPQLGKHLFGGLLKVPSVTLWRGEPWQPLSEMPRRVGEWPAGTTQAFVIDLLEPGTNAVAFRVYYQDSPTRGPIGHLPACLSDKPVDLAIVCAGGATELPRFPEDLLANLRPRYVMGAHWEDFFNPRKLPLPGAHDVKEKIRIVPGLRRGSFLRRVRKALPPGGQATIPCPEAVTYFARQDGRWSIAASDAGWSKPK
jgi:hypothetical protein